MRQVQQVIYILLYLQFFVHNVFTFNIDVSSKDNTNSVMWVNDWKCSSNNNCTAKNSVCNNNLCQCDSGFIFNSDLTACVKVATGFYDSCEETVQCAAYLFSGAKCVENLCVCGPHYYYLHGKCNRYVGLLEKCTQNIDCYVNADFEASTCDEGICKCSPGFYQREYRTCRREGRAVGDECTIDIDCTFDNATCNEFVCAVRFEDPDKTIELLPDVTILTEEIFDIRIRVDSDCTTNEECREMGNAICDPTGTCRCDRAYFASNTDTKCIPELGEPCHNDDVSHIEKSICREGRWSCMSGTVASKDNRECLDVTREYMGNCHLDEQCFIFGPDAICSNDTCICNENSHYVESELFCWGNRGLGETCKQDRDCYVQDFKGNLICNSTCGCPDGMRVNRNSTICIGPTELGGFCEIKSDCATPNSVCEGEECKCAENYYESDKRCLAGINAKCTSNIYCAPENAVCNSQKCFCKPNYVNVSISSCMPVTLFGQPCLFDVQCSAVTTGAICTTIEKKKDTEDLMETFTESEIKVCACKKGDYYRFEKCFKKRLLDETCTNVGECYESYDQTRVVCRNEKCSCIWGYKKSNDSVCVEHPQASKFFFTGSATNVVSIGLFSIISFIFSSKLF